MPAAAAETYSLGDANTDGVVDIRDTMLILRECACSVFPDYPANSLLSEQQMALADVFKSEVENDIDTRDAYVSLHYYVYTLVATNPVSPETFFADPDTYDREVEQSENLDEAVDQAMQEGKDVIEESYQSENSALVEKSYTKGDANLDGIVDELDAAEIMVVWVSYTMPSRDVERNLDEYWTTEQQILADINGDGEITGYDCKVVSRYCVYSKLYADDENAVSIEEFFTDPFGYLPPEMIEIEECALIAQAVHEKTQYYLDEVL